MKDTKRQAWLYRGFYALMIIVPISLIILFSFVIFILPVTQIKVSQNLNERSDIPLLYCFISFKSREAFPQSSCRIWGLSCAHICLIFSTLCRDE